MKSVELSSKSFKTFMNIWIFNHYALTPDLPGGTRHFDMSKELYRRGHRVTIFSSGFHYALLKETKTYNNAEFLIEDFENVKFIWLKTFPYYKNNWKRIINMLSYYHKATKYGKTLKLDKPDIVIGSTVHPLAPLAAIKIAKSFGVPFVFEIRDLWPQTMIDMEVWNQRNIRYRILKFIERYTVKHAQSIIALSPLTKKYLIDNYNYDNVSYIPNGVDLNSFDNRLLKYKNSDLNINTVNYLNKLKRENKFIIMYTGAIVQSNNIDLILNTAISLKKMKYDNIRIVIIGAGEQVDRFKRIAGNYNLDHLFLLDPVEKKYVPIVLSMADVFLLIQGNVFWGSMNKLFDYLASSKPVLSVISVKHNNPALKIDCGISVEPDNSEKLANAIIQLYNMPDEQLYAMGRKGREYVEKNNDIKHLSMQFETVLQEVICKYR